MSKPFNRALRRVRLLWQAGLAVRTLVLVTGLVGGTLFGYAMIDLGFALSTRARVAASIACLLVLTLYAMFQLFRVARLGGRDAAVWADRQLTNRRRIVLGAWELGRIHGGGSVLRQYLVDCSQERAGAAMRKLSAWSCVPWPAVRRSGVGLGLVVLVWLAAWALRPEPTRTLLERMIHPRADVPPVSRIAFNVAQQQPEVIYGDDVELTATLEGHSKDETVWLVTRGRNGIQRRACFREADNMFVQRLENVIEPLHFSFQTRKARSHWYPVHLRLQPRIASARVTIHPPEYAGQAVRRFYVGDESVTALKGAHVELDVKSNRPLGSGVVLVCGDDEGEETSVEGERVGSSGMRFSWDVQRSADVTVRIVDAIGTPSAGHHGFRQILQKDEPPHAAITEPGAFTLVTPEVSVSVEGMAEDDIGLRGVNVVRSLVGYRDRVLPLSLPLGRRTHELALPLDLKLLGLRPGDILEFYLEAADTNPSMGGVAVSDVTRLQVISRAEYAAMLRMKTTVREFSARYQVLAGQLRDLRETLKELAESSDGLDAEARRAAMEKAREAGERASDLFQRMAADFPIFDMEQRLPAILSELKRVNQRYSKEMARLSPPYAQAGKIASRWLKDLEPGAKKLEQEIENAETISKVAGVVSSAIGIRRAIEKQKELVRRLNRYEVDSDVRRLKGFLAKARLQQISIREDLEKIIEQLDHQMRDLPPSQKYLADGIVELLEAFRVSGVLGHMDGASNAALNGDAHETYRQAKLALEALLELLDSCDEKGNPFTPLCRGQGEGKCLQMGEAMQSTMQQMCDALAAMLGAGPDGLRGMAGGGSIGGDPENGYWSNQSTLLNVPVIGPERMRFKPPRGSGRGEGGSGAGQGASRAATQREELPRSVFESTESVDVQPHRVPEPYRDAVKRFYGEGEQP